MKILYATYRYDPANPDLGSGSDYEHYNALLRAGYKIKIVGPVTSSSTLIERAEQWAWRLYKKLSGKNGVKYPLSTAWRASKMLDQAALDYKPDVIFSIFPSFFVFNKRSNIPCVWYFDTTFLGQETAWPLYGELPLALSVMEEKKALSKVAKVFTMSEWSKNILVTQYGFPAERIEIITHFSALPANVIPKMVDVRNEKRLEKPLRLLLVGRVYKRKGVDIALEIVRQLNDQGVPSELTICGLTDNQTDSAHVHFVGPYRKSDPYELRLYTDLYKRAHILIHPARFEAAGFVPSEAAGFGTPTITNDTGGLGTTVKHGESGIVLPRGSPAEVYVKVIKDLISVPDAYYQLCQTTRQRFERELNNEVAGSHLADIIRKVAIEQRSN
jgi:glycosyltransferase involved in cell wall biosynthesis